MSGKFVLVVGTSGSGKGTLMGHVRPLVSDVVFAKSCTTRAMRAGETEGSPYFFLTPDAFKAKIDAGEFLEWAEYGGNFYGTLKSEVVTPLEEGKVVIKEMEVQGARQVLEKLPRQQLSIIFINAGSWEEMEARIKGRAPMGDVELQKRKERYEDEMSFMNDADIVIVNKTGEVEAAKSDFESAIRSIVEEQA